MRLASDIMADLLQELRSTGAPAFMHKDLPRLCSCMLEVLDNSRDFQGCMTHGGPLVAVAIIGVGVLLSEKPQGGAWPGVLALLAHYSGGFPADVILAHTKLMLTCVLSPDSYNT